MGALTPEGKLKQRCRRLCVRLKLPFWNIEGKGINGVPDTLVGKYPPGSGMIFVEAKREGKEPNEQQFKRIAEIILAGGEAGWYDTYEGFCELIGYDLDL